MQGADVIVVSSSGGVLLDVLALEPWLRNHHVRYALVDAADTRDMFAGRDVDWLTECGSSPWQLAISIRRAVRLLRHRRPHLVITAGTGAGLAVVTAAWMLRIPRVWIETFNVIKRPGRASRIGGRLSSVVLVQSEVLVSAFGRKARFVGQLL
jgi:UDP-N-acetylglucosamine:LPS N-acetylglucosamine transferase